MNPIKPRLSCRDALLRTGMGCFLFAVTVSALNVLLLPYARACYGYAALPTLLCVIGALGLFLFAGRRLGALSASRVQKAAHILVPAFCIVLFFLHLLLGYLMEYTPMGDNFMLYIGSQTLAADGDFHTNPDFGLYLARFSNQWGFLLMLTGFYRLLAVLGITQTFLPVVLVQAGLYTLGMGCAFSIADRLRGARGQLLLLLMLMLCLPLYLAAAVLYTDTFSLPFILLVIELAMRAAQEKTGLRQCLLILCCALCAFIGSQIKMTVVIALMAACIFFLLRLPLRRSLPACALCAALMMGGTAGVHQFMLERVIDPAVYAQENTPAIHWLMMSIPTSNNPYGGATGDYGITWGMMDAGASHEEVMDSIYTRIKDRIYTLRYPDRLLGAMARKNAAALGDGTFGMTEMLDDGPVRENIISAIVLEGRPGYALYSALCAGIWCAHLLLSAWGCLRDIRRRDLRAALPAIALFGAMLFLMLWEARGRYIFGFVPVMLLLSMHGALPAPQKEEGLL